MAEEAAESTVTVEESQAVDLTEPPTPPPAAHKVATAKSTSDAAIKADGTARLVRTVEARVKDLEAKIHWLFEKQGFTWPKK